MKNFNVKPIVLTPEGLRASRSQWRKIVEAAIIGLKLIKYANSGAKIVKVKML